MLKVSKVLTIILVIIFSLSFICASCHPKKALSPQVAQPPTVTPAQPKDEESKQNIQQEEKKIEDDKPLDEKIKEEPIIPNDLPQKEREFKHQQLTTPSLGAAENMARESLKILEKGDITGAVLIAERAIGLEPYCGYCYYALASIRAAQRMWKDVIPLATSALQYLFDDRAAKAAYIRALAYYYSGDLEKAKADCEYALSIDPELEAAKRLLLELR